MENPFFENENFYLKALPFWSQSIARCNIEWLYKIEFILQVMGSGGIETNWECCVESVKILGCSRIHSKRKN